MISIVLFLSLATSKAAEDLQSDLFGVSSRDLVGVTSSDLSHGHFECPAVLTCVLLAPKPVVVCCVFVF